MKLRDIYAPIRKELAEVERNLEATADVDIPLLARLLKHVLKNGGKRIRPALTLLAGKFYHYQPRHLVPMATGVELLHTATLVHDDTIDGSVIRRGKVTVNSLWGRAQAILLGDYLFAKAATFVAITENVRAIKLFAQTLTVISSGELRESAHSFSLRQFREHYYEWVGAKTACLFSAAAEAGAIVSQAPEEVVLAFRDYGYNLGMAFQIVDDILDFIGEEAEMGKSVGADLSQGILTLPTILFLEQHPRNRLLRQALEKKPPEGLKLAIDQIRQSSVIKESFDIALEFCSKAVKALGVLPDNNVHQALDNLTKYCLQRQK